MKQKKLKGGYTLIESIATLLILVFLVVGMGPGMQAASQIYREATFETDTAILADVINTSVGDVLRYADRIDLTTREGEPLPVGIPFVFTSFDYRIQDGFFALSDSGAESGTLQMLNLRNSSAVDLVNLGVYPNLKLENFSIEYDGDALFFVKYRISATESDTPYKDVEFVVRLMNS